MSSDDSNSGLSVTTMPPLHAIFDSVEGCKTENKRNIGKKLADLSRSLRQQGDGPGRHYGAVWIPSAVAGLQLIRIHSNSQLIRLKL